MTVKVEFSLNTGELEVKYLYNHLNAAAICLRTSATQFSATTSISTLEPITGRKSETAIPRNIDGSRIGKTIRRSRYSTEYAILETLEKIKSAVDDQQITCGIVIDFSKAFDTINHHILLEKLYKYGIRGLPHAWFSDYITNRKPLVLHRIL